MQADTLLTSNGLTRWINADPAHRHFYNPLVNWRISPTSPMQRWLILLLTGVLALAPFLHGHLGGLHSGGFHLDGVSQLAVATKSHGAVQEMSEQELPTVGVVASLSQEVDTILWLAHWVCLLGVLWTLTPPVLLRSRPAQTRSPLRTLYRPGLPPPGLPPPGLLPPGLLPQLG